MRGRLLSISLALWLGLMAVAGAHHLWLIGEPHMTGTVPTAFRLEARTGNEFPETEVAIQPARIERSQVIGPTGPVSDVHWQALQDRSVAEVRLEAPGAYWVTMELRPRFIALSAQEFNEYLKHEGLTAILELRRKLGLLDRAAHELYAKYAKALLVVRPTEGDLGGPAVAAVITKPVGLKIEIVPQGVPQLGTELPIQVLFEGQPVGPLQVFAGAEGAGPAAVFSTDARGRVRIPLNRPGRWNVRTIHMIHLKEPLQWEDRTVEWISYWATLTMEVSS
ncbi:MAG: DUF4198 domain-containing protein [Acidobacteria bacterium]|nr:DUF4198 domain-containing protein [Acidobacteriota bacterium]MDW7984133.1 DUF4198 domain-containing protein [Acidobacteriota bacterium]